jgi:hypothetical protein
MELELQPMTSPIGMINLAFHHGSLAQLFPLRRIRRLLRRGRFDAAAARAERIVRRGAGHRARDEHWVRLRTGQLLARLGAVDEAIDAILLEETRALAADGHTTRAEMVLKDVLTVRPDHPEARRQLEGLS